MSAVLTKDSTVKCSHPTPGTVTLGTGAAKLRVQGKAVLRAQDVVTIASGCGFKHPTPQGAVPCSKVMELTRGTATKLRVGGVPVVLDTLQGTTNSSPTPGSLKVTANQPKLTAK